METKMETREQVIQEIFSTLETTGEASLGKFGKLVMRTVSGKMQNLPRGGQVLTLDRTTPRFEISTNYKGYLAMK